MVNVVLFLFTGCHPVLNKLHQLAFLLNVQPFVALVYRSIKMKNKQNKRTRTEKLRKILENTGTFFKDVRLKVK